jgi:acetyl-CoA acetyltransferase
VSLLGRPVAVAGVGQTPPQRKGEPDIRTLTLAACREALDDAGLAPGDVDAVFQYSFGSDAPIAIATQRMLGLDNLRAFNDIMGSGPSGLAGAMNAAMAIATGVCETALCYRTITAASGHTGVLRASPEEVGGTAQFTAPYGYSGGIILGMAMRKRRRIAELGGSVEDYGAISVNARRWASLNPRAVFQDPITMDDYLASRVLADPLVLLDCDYPVSVSVAAVLTTEERARDLPKPVVRLDALAYGTGAGADWVFGDDFLFGGAIDCGRELWGRSSYRPDDVDVAQLYDGFTHIALSWVEALGLCGIGEFHDWVDGGRTIGPGGALPLNTYGGQLGAGRLHGLGFLSEAVIQLRGEAGARQVPDARVAVVAGAQGPQAGAMVVARD